MEDSRRSCGIDSFSTCRRTTQTNYCHKKGNVGSTWGKPLTL